MLRYVGELKSRLGASQRDYFRALADGSFSRDDFVATQVQFLSAVTHFAKPMEILGGRLPVDERQSLIENIADEHGHGDPSASHTRTFIDLLGRLGVPEPELATHTPWPEVDAFNATLTATCAFDDPLTGVATLAIIEDIFAELSAKIGTALVAREWLARGEVVHYATHEVLDLHHSASFYRVIEPHFAKRADVITRGLELGGYIFVRMYDDLYRARERRWRR